MTESERKIFALKDVSYTTFEDEISEDKSSESDDNEG